MVEKIEELLGRLKTSAEELMQQNASTKDFYHEYALGMLLVISMIEDVISGD